ncbi:MAG: response regulator [Oscillatoriales cyanobacterium C42_A2020_001]|nr:response regulator [Leptolyngbyaceae cyanobacterium C42_A2020_001]
MNTASMISYGSSQMPQRLHPLSLFAQVTSQQVSGCLRVTSGAVIWFIFLEKGKLSFASNSINPFERLDRHLNHLSLQVPALVSAVRAQARSLFERSKDGQSLTPPDYLAVRWLVDQHYLSATQAAHLVGELAKEVFESLLRVSEGSYELIESQVAPDFSTLCQLELRPLVEYCQAQLRRQSVARSSTFSFQEAPSQEALEASYGTGSDPTLGTEGPFTTPESNALKGGYTIACIDDSPTVLQAINSFLEDSNLSIVMINDPLKALIQIIRCKPDLILLDVGMPNLDGYELCSMLRRHPNFKTTPIVMVTGNTGFIDRAKAKLVGASGYLTKPFTRPELMKMVFKHLT